MIPALQAKLERSLDRQRAVLSSSIILTPVDSIALDYSGEGTAAFLHGFYVSDKIKTEQEKRDSKIQFPGRDRATLDVNAIHAAFAETLGAATASLRLLSGLHAHIVVFMCLANFGDSVVLLPETAGGHFSTRVYWSAWVSGSSKCPSTSAGVALIAPARSL